MAFENGTNAFNYAKNIFKKYQIDNMIFTKALQVIQIYQNRVDFPYCIDDLVNTVDKILGGSFLTFFFTVTFLVQLKVTKIGIQK